MKAGAIASFVGILSITSPPFQGDSAIYVKEVLSVYRGSAPYGSLWEFGHLCWRPLMYALSPVLLATIPDFFAATPELKLTLGAAFISMLFALGCVLLFIDVLYKVGCTAWGVVVSVGILILGDSFLSYSQTATSYIPALFFLLFALWWPLENKRTLFARAAVSGLSLFLMVAFWFPFGLAAPAVAVAGPLLGRRERLWRESLLALLVFGFALLFGFGLGAYLSGCRDAADLARWIHSSSHGWEQNRRLLRAFSGCARLLIDLGFSGVLMKRFAFHDPLNPVRLSDLAIKALLPVALFWLLIGITLAACIRKAKARPALIVFLVGACPLFWFATVLLEPSSPERFLPVLPFFLLLVALLWQLEGKLAACARFVAIAFVCLLPVMNGPTFLKGLGESAGIERRLEDFRRHAGRTDEIVSVTISDPIGSKPLLVESFPMVDIGNASAAHWRELFSAEVLTRWKNGIDVWVEKDMFLSRPPSGSRWVEGDDPRVTWHELRDFVGKLEYDRETSRADGFRRIARSDSNQRVFLAGVGRSWQSGLNDDSIADRKTLAAMAGSLEFVNDGDGIVFHRDAALAVFVGGQFIATETKYPSALARFEVGTGAEVSPVDIGREQKCQGFAMRFGNRLPFFGKEGSVDELSTIGQHKTSRAADHEKARSFGLFDCLDKTHGHIG